MAGQAGPARGAGGRPRRRTPDRAKRFRGSAPVQPYDPRPSTADRHLQQQSSRHRGSGRSGRAGPAVFASDAGGAGARLVHRPAANAGVERAGRGSGRRLWSDHPRARVRRRRGRAMGGIHRPDRGPSRLAAHRLRPGVADRGTGLATPGGRLGRLPAHRFGRLWRPGSRSRPQGAGSPGTRRQ